MTNKNRFETFGCRLNFYETEVMRKISERTGLTNSVIVNTCAVTSEAVKKAKKSLRKLRREEPKKKIIVTGCASQIDPTNFTRTKTADVILGNGKKLSERVWRNIAATKKRSRNDVVYNYVDDIMSVKDNSLSRDNIITSFAKRSRAYVQIQNGCNHRCTFCIIPYGRGNSRSLELSSVIEQIKILVDNGFKEVVLTGVDLTDWGKDLSTKLRLGKLVKEILKFVPDLSRLRLSSIDSIEVDTDLLEVISYEKRFMPHLHLSIQSGDNLILKRMKRRHNRENIIEFCERLIMVRPEITFGADFIAGFPTETKEMFSNTLALVKECNITWLHIFPYSIRQGTPAALMPQVDKETIRSRAQILRQASDNQVKAYLNLNIGKTHNILVENHFLGRTETFAEVLFKKQKDIGSILSATIADHNGKQLITN